MDKHVKEMKKDQEIMPCLHILFLTINNSMKKVTANKSKACHKNQLNIIKK